MCLNESSIVYLTWGETPRSYGVFGNQVIEQFKRISNYSTRKFHFISGVPIIHSGLVREKWNYMNEIREIRKALGSVTFSRIPILAPQTFFNSSSKTFSFFHGFSHTFLAKKLRKLMPAVVHCRSYHAAWAALKVRESYEFNYKIVFDGRDMWPEEVALKNKYSEGSVDYTHLKNIEKELLQKCDLSIGVSDEMCSYYESLGANKTQCVYLSADTELFSSDFNQEKYQIDTVKFCYVGALSESGWHKVSELHKLYSKLRTLYNKTHLTIVTTSDHSSIKSFFCDIPEKEITLTSSKSRVELSRILSTQHVGLMAYFSPSNKLHVALGKILLAIKTVEYLSAGLPMICNAYCGGASYILKENLLGEVYKPECINITSEQVDNLINVNVAKNCIGFAKDNFDIETNAKKYNSLYQLLLND